MGYKKITALVITAAVAASMALPGFADTALKGNLVDPVWVNNQQVVVGEEKALGLEFYLVNTTDGSAKLLIPEEKNATEVAASTDGSMIAYINDNGDVYKMNMSDLTEEKISSDNDTKSELTWTAGNSKLYFLKGEKYETIAAITLATKKTANILADSVAYKSDLSVSQDGKKMIYTVTNAGSTDAVTLAVSTKGTEPQIYRFDMTENGAKPKKLTSSLDNKSYSFLTASGSAMYLSTDPSGPSKKSVVRWASYDGKLNVEQNMTLEVHQNIVTPDGNAWYLATNAEKKQVVYNVAAQTERFDVPAEIREITLSPDANKAVAIIQGTEKSTLQLITKSGTKALN